MVDRSKPQTFVNQSGSELRVPPSGSELMVKSPVIADVMVQSAQVAGENVVVGYLTVSALGYPLLERANLVAQRAGIPLTDTDSFLFEVTGNPQLVNTITMHLGQIEQVFKEVESGQSMLLNESGGFVWFPPIELSQVGGLLAVTECTEYQKHLLELTVRYVSFAHLFLRFY